MKYLLKYTLYSDIKQGDHKAYSTDTEKEVAIKAATDEEAIAQAKKEWASITSRKQEHAAVAFDDLVKVLSWRPKNTRVPLDEKVFFTN